MGRLGGFWNEGAARRLAIALEESGLGPEAVAQALGVEPRTVRNWLQYDSPPTNPTLNNLAGLCKLVGVPVAEFRAAAEAYLRESGAAVSSSGHAPPTEPAAHETAPATRRLSWQRRRGALAGTLAVAGLALLGFAGAFVWRRSGATRPTRPLVSSYSIPSSDDNYEEAWAGRISPDGRYVAFLAVPREPLAPIREDSPQRRLFLLSTERGARAIPIPGADGLYTTFFWDAESEGVYFIRAKTLMFAALEGGPVREVASVGEGTYGDANAKHEIVLGSRRGLVFVSPEGRVEFGRSSTEEFFPIFLPDGDRLLFLRQRLDANGNPSRDLYLMSLRTRSQRLIERRIPSRVVYNNGYLLYARNCALYARSFNLATETLGRREYLIKEDVWLEDGAGSASFSVSQDGVLVTQGPAVIPALEAVSLTPSGVKRTPVAGLTNVKRIALGPHPGELVVARADRCTQVQSLWRWSPSGRRAAECLTCGKSASTSPVLSPDGKTLYFAATRGAVMGIYSLSTERYEKEKLVFASSQFPAPRDAAPNGKSLLIEMTTKRDGGLFELALESPAAAVPLIDTPDMEGEAARYSPDGRFIAFSAIRSSGNGVFLLAVGHPSGEARLVGPRGWRCRWSSDGRKLFYVVGRAVMEYDLRHQDERELFEMGQNITDAAAVGAETFYVVTLAESHNRVDGNWTRALPPIRPGTESQTQL
jgi:transcriptional regulator with XRE-family HTH domain